VTVRFSGLVYLILGAFTAVLGAGEIAVPNVTPLTDGRWFGGMALLGIGVLLVASAVGLLRPAWTNRLQPLYRPAGAASLVVGGYLEWNSLRYVFDPWRFTAWFVWCFAGAFAVLFLPKAPTPETDAEPAKGLLRRLATAGVTLTLVWGVIQATALQALSSAAVGTTLTVTVALARERGADNDAGRGYRLTVDIKNPTSVRVPIVASLYRVFALSAGGASDKRTTPLAYRAVPVGDSAVVVAYDTVTPDAWYLEPGETFHRQVVVLLPTAEVSIRPVLRATVDLLVAKAPRFAAVPASARVYTDRNDVVVEDIALPVLGPVHVLTRGRQRLRVEVYPRAGLPSLPATGGPPALFSPHGPALGTSADVFAVCVNDARRWPDHLCDGPYETTWARFYGLVGTTATTEIGR
jgi:hypothetical protein